MKRSILLGLFVLFLLTCLIAEQHVISRTELGISVEEAVSVYHSGPTVVQLRNTTTNQTIIVPATWQEGNLIIHLDDDNDVTILRGRFDHHFLPGTPTWVIEQHFPPVL